MDLNFNDNLEKTRIFILDNVPYIVLTYIFWTLVVFFFLIMMQVIDKMMERKLEIGNPKSKMGNAGWFCWCLGGMRPSRSHGKKCNEMEMNFGLQRLRKNDKQGPAHNKSYTA